MCSGRRLVRRKWPSGALSHLARKNFPFISPAIASASECIWCAKDYRSLYVCCEGLVALGFSSSFVQCAPRMYTSNQEHTTFEAVPADQEDIEKRKGNSFFDQWLGANA